MFISRVEIYCIRIGSKILMNVEVCQGAMNDNR